MVNGIESFRQKFKNYADCYTIIGGTACDILMSSAGLEFRATKDIDMIVIFEDKGEEFAKVFWEYIKEGNYKCGSKNDEHSHFYRFTCPKIGYPSMIELFSRKQNYNFKKENIVIPVYTGDDVSSLSAILLNDDYYNFMLEGKTIIDNVSVLGAEYLIPFKMYAWIDLVKKKNEGQKVKSTDIKKHKYDVFRLLQIARLDKTIETSGLVKEVICEFIERMKTEEFPLSQLNIVFNADEGIEMLKELYGI